MTGFKDPLILIACDDGINWIVYHEFRYTTGEGEVIYVPAGFRTDFASIPRFLWRIIGPPATGKYRKAAVIHDWLYRTEGLPYSKLRSDEIFLEAMKHSGVEAWRRTAIYQGVNWFGGSSFKGL